MTLELEHDEHGPECSAEEFELRGVLASKLKCWHRLTEEEVANLLEFVRGLGVRAAEPLGWPHKWGCRANAFGECNMGCTAHAAPTQPQADPGQTFGAPIEAAQKITGSKKGGAA